MVSTMAMIIQFCWNLARAKIRLKRIHCDAVFSLVLLLMKFPSKLRGKAQESLLNGCFGHKLREISRGSSGWVNCVKLLFVNDL